MIFEKYNEATIIIIYRFAYKYIQHARGRLCIRLICCKSSRSLQSVTIWPRVTISLALPVCSAGPGWFELWRGLPCPEARPPVPWAIWLGSGCAPVSRLWCIQHNSPGPRIPGTSGRPLLPAWRSRIPRWHGSSIAYRPEVRPPAGSSSPRCYARLLVPKSVRLSHPERSRSALGCPWAHRLWKSRTWPPYPPPIAVLTARTTQTTSPYFWPF